MSTSHFNKLDIALEYAFKLFRVTNHAPMSSSY